MTILISKFFEDRDIFITGGSGFIGKALIEKLLRSCPTLNKIYVLIRAKGNKSAEERLSEILKSPLFDRLRNENSSGLEKAVAIEGDISCVGLGIQKQQYELLQNVSIIYHSAASVRFDDSLRDAIILNTRGTLEVMKLSESLANIQVVIHVSTTYCNPDKHVIEEKIYPPYADWRVAIKLAETYSTETLNILSQKYSQFQPNTYTFTKSLSEQIVNEYKGKLPLIIYRPSIVVSTILEPVSGWTDNFNGPTGLLIACGMGILRTMHGDPNVVSDFTPVDLVVKAMIVATYKKGIEKHDSQHLDVYNCSVSNIHAISTGELIDLGKRLIKENPFERTLWVPGGGITTCRFLNYVRFMLFHLLLAILVDSGLRLSSAKPFFLRLQRRIYSANLALHYFATTNWTFKNEAFLALDDYVPKSESSKFAFKQLSEISTESFFRNCVCGAKKYLLNEPAECTRKAKIKFEVMSIIHFFLKLTFWLFLTRSLIRYAYNRIF